MLSLEKKNVLILFMCQSLGQITNAITIITGGLIGYSFAYDKSLATLPIAFLMMAVMCTTVPISYFMKKYGRRAGFYLGCFMGSIGAALACYAIWHKSFWGFSLAMGFIGFFHGSSLFYRYTAIDVASEAFKNKAISYVIAGGVVAAIIAAPLSRYTRDLFEPHYFVGCYAVFFVIFLFISFFLTFLKVPQKKTESSTKKDVRIRPIKEIAKQPSFIIALLSSTVGYGIMVLVMTSTPIAMEACLFTFSDTTTVIQWHALGMYIPSFFTGKLIDRFGKVTIILCGAFLFLICACFNLYDIQFYNFWVALLLLGVGWNFMFVGGTSLLTETYEEDEKAKVQAINDFIIFGTVTLCSLGSGWLLHNYGWKAVNMGILPFILFILIVSSWFKLKRMKFNPTS